jgi:hypothetical protein
VLGDRLAHAVERNIEMLLAGDLVARRRHRRAWPGEDRAASGARGAEHVFLGDAAAAAGALQARQVQVQLARELANQRR